MKKVVALGTLREDIVIKFDFSTPMEKMEMKINNLNKSVGGSVNNTCAYLAKMDSQIEVVMCTLNYADLVEIVESREKINNYHISVTQESFLDHPVSIIGVKENGEKQMISYDPSIDETQLISLFKEEAKKSDLLYTSFYEISDTNYNVLVRIFSEAIDSGKIVVLDFCPVINKKDKIMLREILLFTTVVSGNIDEYQMLLSMFDMNNFEEIFWTFPTIKEIYVKEGEKGSSLYRKNNENGIIEKMHIDGMRIASIKNTTGCGDVFNAVIIEGMLNNRDYETLLESAVRVSGKIAERGLPWIRE